MAEQVNQRIEEMINELEQMKRTNLYSDEEIKEISRNRKEFEYKLQRRVKQKEDYVHYIAYELALLEDIAIRRKQAKLTEKRKDIEHAIAGRLNKLFKQFIMRFQDIEIYFEYIKFCKAVGYENAVLNILSQMLQLHGDKPRMWQLASKWESQEQNNFENAREFLLKGIHRHSHSDILYLDLFEIELKLALQADKEEQEKLLKRADVVWKNSVKNIEDLAFLFKLCDAALKFQFPTITEGIKKMVWEKRENKEVWVYIALKELEGCHWQEIEEFVDEEYNFPKEINYYIAVYEECLQKFPDSKLTTKYIHGLLGLSDSLCTDQQKIRAIKHAWTYGHEAGLLTNDMYAFGIEMLKLENDASDEELMQILNTALKVNPQMRYIWEEKLNLSRSDWRKVVNILSEATKHLKAADTLFLWNLTLKNLDSKEMVQNLYKQFKNCQSSVLLSIKPSLLQKMYEHNGLKSARDMYDEFIRTPPTQQDLHRVMIDIEKSQDKPNVKALRKCYECSVQHHGKDNIEVWMDYMTFEMEQGSAQASPAIYRRALAVLNKECVDQFIKAQTLLKLK